MSLFNSFVSSGKAPPFITLLVSGFHVASLVASILEHPDSPPIPSNTGYLILEPSKTIPNAFNASISSALLLSVMLAFAGLSVAFITMSKGFLGANPPSVHESSGGEDTSDGDDPPEPGDSSGNTDGENIDSDTTGFASNGGGPPPPPPPAVNSQANGKPKLHWLILFLIWLFWKLAWSIVVPHIIFRHVIFRYWRHILAFMYKEKTIRAARVAGDWLIFPFLKHFFPSWWAYIVQVNAVFQEFRVVYDQQWPLFVKAWASFNEP